MKVTQDKSIAFNSATCDIHQLQMTFYIVLSQKMEWNQCTRPKALLRCFSFTGIQQLQSSLGVINFMISFMPHMLHHTLLFRKHLKKNNTFVYDVAINWMIQWLKALMVLEFQQPLFYHDHSMIITGKVDSPCRGLSTPYQRGNPLHSYPSPSLTIGSSTPTQTGGC